MTKISRENCPIMRAAKEIGDQKTLLILREFFLEGTRRFRDLELVLGMSPDTLSARLKKLEQDGIVAREIYSERPLRAEYRLTEKGEAIAPIMNAIYDWGMAHTPDPTQTKPKRS